LFFLNKKDEYVRQRFSAVTIETIDELVPQTDKWGYWFADSVAPILEKIILMYKDNRLHLVWNSLSLKRPKFIKIKEVIENENLYNVDLFLFCLQEISFLNTDVMCDFEFKELCRKHIGKTFMIPQYSSGYLTGIKEMADGEIYFTTLKDSQEGLETIRGVFQWCFDKVYPFLTYLGD